ncbi:MAG: acetate--CoA ligase family protein, partial [Gammaproteobacteria bacterium]|nr:acetate--CoA ligase family protein [Gammaproteobacteria bacterium]
MGGTFEGAIYPVNPKYKTVAGMPAYRRVTHLPEVPDLAVICTPPRTVPGLIAELGERGTKAAVVLTAGLARERDSQGRTLQQAMLDAACPHLLRILGPNCVGLMLPNIGLNASFAHTHPLAGNLAFVTQSGALATAILDWAKSRHIGFSHFISVGDSADVDFGDLLDYLGSDAQTSAVLLYIESIDEARKFMSAARAAARNKAVIVVKSGRVAESAKAAASHTGALAGSDDVYDAAIRRAGMLRVETTEDLFDAVETLSRVRRCSGESLAILTNGGGPGVMATDALIKAGGKLAELRSATVADLDSVLPNNWSRGNPVDIIGDAPAQRYVDALQVLAHAAEVDAILFIHAPSAIVGSRAIAEALVPVIKSAGRSVLSCWLGGDGVGDAARLFTAEGLATYASPEDAAKSFMQLVAYERNQRTLTETPSSIPTSFEPDLQQAREIIRAVIDEQRELLSESEAKQLLAAYGIPIVETRVATNAEKAANSALEIGFPVAVKVLSPDISHKSDVGGVVLHLDNAEQVREACKGIIERASTLQPGARLQGFTVQSMVNKPTAHELILGVASDAVFGPVLLFGQGGTAVEVIGDRAVALPPLNQVLAREMVQRTRVSRLLAGYRDRPAADLDAIYAALIKLSQLVADLPQVIELDINPLLADADGVIVLDARVRVMPSTVTSATHLAIRPYPKELEELVAFNDGQVLVRPIRPEDEPAHR